MRSWKNRRSTTGSMWQQARYIRRQSKRELERAHQELHTELVSVRLTCDQMEAALQAAVASEQAARQEEQRQRDLLEAIVTADPGGLAILTGERLEHVFVNPAYRSLIPHPELDPIGQSYSQVWPQHENLRGSWLLRRVLTAASEFFIERYAQPFPDGSTRYFTMSMRQMLWNNQSAVLLVLWDTTETERAYQQAQLAAEHSQHAADEARSRAKEAQEGRRVLDALMEYIPAGIAIASGPDGIVQLVSRYGREMNPALEQLTGAVPLDDQPGFWALHDPRTGELACAQDLPLFRVLRHGDEIINEEWMMQRDGAEPVYVLCSAGAIRSPSGEITGGLLTWQDITQRKVVEEALASYAQRLERSNRELQAFAFVASHDLQEPLRKIQAFGSRLKERASDRLTETELDFLSRMQSAANRMSEMITDLLQYSRVTTKALPFEPVKLEDVVQEVLSDLVLRLERSGGQVQIGPLPVVEADRIQMYQLFQNLIGNALKFHRPAVSPLVRIHSEVLADPANPRRRQARIWVEDNGIGFDESFMERIFQPFERLHGRSEYEGTGMGLAICRKIVERHGGSIIAHSQPEQGTRFEITLPLPFAGRETG